MKTDREQKHYRGRTWKQPWSWKSRLLQVIVCGTSVQIYAENILLCMAAACGNCWQLLLYMLVYVSCTWTWKWIFMGDKAPRLCRSWTWSEGTCTFSEWHPYVPLLCNNLGRSVAVAATCDIHLSLCWIRAAGGGRVRRFVVWWKRLTCELCIRFNI